MRRTALAPLLQPRLVAGLAAAAWLWPCAAAQAANPQGVDTSEWECSQCPPDAAGKTEAEFEAGALHVSDDAARFGRYTGLNRDGAYPVLAGSASQQLADGSRWNLEARDLGLDGRSIQFRGGRPGLDLRLGYDQQPHYLFDTASTTFLRDTPGALALPTGFVRAGNTQLMRTLQSSLQPVDIERQRHTVSAALRAALGTNWSTYAGYRQQKRDGTWRQGASFGFSALELPSPVEDVTDSAEFGARYAGARLSGQLGYEGSFYSNRRTALSFENPYLGPARGQLALAPDNSAHQVAGTLNYRFSTHTALSATAAVGLLRQDDTLLPYTIAALPPSGPLPRASADAKVDTTHLSLAFVTGLDGLAPIFRTARLKVDVRYDEHDNSTPAAAWAYIVTDQFTSTPATNQAFGFEQLRLAVSGDYDLRQLLRFVPERQKLRISGGWRRDEVKRSLQEATDSTEDTGWGRVSWQPAGWLGLAVKWGGANREVDAYNPVATILAPQNPLMRKYNMADRERQFAEGTLTLQPRESLSLVATGRYANDDYINSRIGLRGSLDRGSTVGASWTPFAGATLFADYSWERIRARQAGSASFGRPDWFAETEDRFRSASAGFRVDGIGKELDLDVRAFLANSRGDTGLRTPSADQLPSLQTRMNGAEIGVAWHRKAPLTVRAALRYEHLDTDDYALDGVSAATVPTLLSLGADAFDYDVQTFMLSFRYRFGGQEAAARAE